MDLQIEIPVLIPAVSGAAIFVVRYARTVAAEARVARGIPFKAFGWYPSDSIAGTSSQRYREFMISHNRLTAAMWACFALSAVIYILGRAYATGT